jgi:hypothetical protein
VHLTCFDKMTGTSQSNTTGSCSGVSSGSLSQLAVRMDANSNEISKAVSCSEKKGNVTLQEGPVTTGSCVTSAFFESVSTSSSSPPCSGSGCVANTTWLFRIPSLINPHKQVSHARSQACQRGWSQTPGGKEGKFCGEQLRLRRILSARTAYAGYA